MKAMLKNLMSRLLVCLLLFATGSFCVQAQQAQDLPTPEKVNVQKKDKVVKKRTKNQEAKVVKSNRKNAKNQEERKELEEMQAKVKAQLNATKNREKVEPIPTNLPDNNKQVQRKSAPGKVYRNSGVIKQ